MTEQIVINVVVPILVMFLCVSVGIYRLLGAQRKLKRHVDCRIKEIDSLMLRHALILSTLTDSLIELKKTMEQQERKR